MTRIFCSFYLLAALGSSHAQGMAIFANGFEQAAPVSRVVSVNPGTVLLTQAGESRPLDARVFDTAGAEVAAQVRFESSRPGQVSVSDQGLVTALTALGSGTVTVSAEGALPVQVLVVVAQPAAGVLLVSDDQVVAPPTAVDPGAVYGLGSQITVGLAGIAAPAPGTVVLGTGHQPLGGRVVSAQSKSTRVDVVLEVIAIHEMFDQVEIDERFDLSRAPLVPSPELAAVYDYRIDLDGGVRLVRPAASKTAIDVDISFFKCKTNTPAINNVLTTDVGPGFDLQRNLDFDLQVSGTSLQRFVIEGSAQALFEIKPRLQAQFSGDATCKLELGTIVIPFGGPFSLILGGQVPLGVGFKVAGSMGLSEPVGYDVTVTASGAFSAGIDCTGGCETVATLEASADGEFRPVLPDLSTLIDSLQVKVSGFGFFYFDVGVGHPLLQALSFKPLGVKAGLRQSVDFKGLDAQAGDPNYASDFKFELLAEAGATNDFIKLIQMLAINASQFKLEVAETYAESPKGTLVITDGNGGSSATPANPAAAAAGESATFTVNLNPITYLGIDAVEAVQIMEAVPNGSGGFNLQPGPAACMALAAAPEQSEFTCSATFATPGERTFHAFVLARLFNIPIELPLEIGKQSAAGLTVSGQGAYQVFVAVDDQDGNRVEQFDSGSQNASALVANGAATASGSATDLTLGLTASTNSGIGFRGFAEQSAQFTDWASNPGFPEGENFLVVRMVGTASTGESPTGDSSAEVTMTVTSSQGACSDSPCLYAVRVCETTTPECPFASRPVGRTFTIGELGIGQQAELTVTVTTALNDNADVELDVDVFFGE